jgi:uncharacterized protein YndB with AHSA1/START domain
MSTRTAATSVTLDVVVDVPVATAFRVFTEDFDKVKPREYNLLQVPIEQTVFEPRVGGHIYDRGTDGSVCRWARVLAFDPPERLVFSWDITPQWRLETDPDRASEVEVRFVAEGENRTRVVLEHRHLDRHGDGWEASVQALASEASWPLFLRRFAEATGGAQASESA